MLYLEHAVQRVCKNCTSDPSRGLVYYKAEMDGINRKTLVLY